MGTSQAAYDALDDKHKLKDGGGAVIGSYAGLNAAQRANHDGIYNNLYGARRQLDPNDPSIQGTDLASHQRDVVSTKNELDRVTGLQRTLEGQSQKD